MCASAVELCFKIQSGARHQSRRSFFFPKIPNCMHFSVLSLLKSTHLDEGEKRIQITIKFISFFLKRNSIEARKARIKHQEKLKCYFSWILSKIIAKGSNQRVIYSIDSFALNIFFFLKSAFNWNRETISCVRVTCKFQSVKLWSKKRRTIKFAIWTKKRQTILMMNYE